MVMMKFSSIKRPEAIKVLQKDQCYGRFVIEPYEKGFGVTIGNSLRRIMLSSIMGSSVTGVFIDGVTNEFSTAPGVLEDIVEITLNLKTLKVEQQSHSKTKLVLRKKGKGPVTAADIEPHPDVFISDQEQLICNITSDDTELYMEIYVETGLGYVPSEEIAKRFDGDVNVLAIDAAFSPVLKVAFEVEGARVGQSTDYDRLLLEVETDGTLPPEDCVAYAAKVLKDQMDLFINFEEPEEELEEVSSDGSDELSALLDKSIEELELSVRASNCLKHANISSLRELVSQTDSDLLKTKNFGKKSLDEVKQVLADMGLSLGLSDVE